MHGLGVYVKEWFSFVWGLSQENLLLFPLSITIFTFWTVLDAISSNIDEVLSINPSADAFVFQDFKGYLCYKNVFLW